MNSRILIPFDDVLNMVMYACYISAFEKDHELVNGEVLAIVLENIISSNILARHFETLINEGYLEPWNSSYKRVSNKLILHVEQKISSRKEPFYSLHRYGVGWLREYYQIGPEEAGDDPATADIPASDRLVRLDHNDPAISKAIQDVDALTKQLRESNDLGGMSAEAAEVAISEVEQISADLKRPAIRMPAFGDRARSTLSWIGKEAAGALVGAAALALLALLASILGFIF